LRWGDAASRVPADFRVNVVVENDRNPGNRASDLRDDVDRRVCQLWPPARPQFGGQRKTRHCIQV
jgi:hypothetical protein